MRIEKNKSLKDLNSFHIDVNASMFLETDSIQELISYLSSKMIEPKDILILGGGSNVLFTKHLPMLVVKYTNSFIEILDEDKEFALLKASAGTIWNDVVNFAVERNLGGIENLIAIPGTAGAAPIQNIGAYGQEVKDSFHSLNGFNLFNYEEKEITKDECNFGYRSSIFKNELKNLFFVSDIILKLKRNPLPDLSYKPVAEEIKKQNILNPSIKNVAKIIEDIRNSKLPDPEIFGNAGSFFKNPEVTKIQFEEIKKIEPAAPCFILNDEKVKIPAAFLIESAGMKGVREGNVGTNPNQPLVIMNYGGATGDEIFKFSQQVKLKVFQKFNLLLQEEVNIL